MDKLLHRVRGLVERGERIGTDDCRALFQVNDLNAFSALGRIVRERRYGLNAYFRGVETLRYRGEHPELFLSEAETLAPEGTVEFLIRIEWSRGDTVELWRERFDRFAASHLPITVAISATFVVAAAEASKRNPADVLQEFGRILPVLLSGHDAFVFDQELRGKWGAGLVDSEKWLALHSGAHGGGWKTEATMAYHTSWNPDLYVSHLDLIRSLQEKTGGFRSFMPVAWHDPEPTAPYQALPTAATTLKVATICRLFLDNIPHVAAAPGLTDPELAYVALSYGADTIDPTLRPEDITSGTGVAPVLSGGELTVLSEGEQSRDDRPDLRIVEERIVEARFRPVPVLSNGEKLELVLP